MAGTAGDSIGLIVETIPTPDQYATTLIRSPEVESPHFSFLKGERARAGKASNNKPQDRDRERTTVNPFVPFEV